MAMHAGNNSAVAAQCPIYVYHILGKRSPRILQFASVPTAFRLRQAIDEMFTPEDTSHFLSEYANPT